MSDRTQLIRLASQLPKGSPERRTLLGHLKGGSQGKTAVTDETTSFIDWVMLNQDPMSERAMTTLVEKLLGRSPAPYVKKTKRGPNIEVGDLLMPKPSKAPAQNEDVAEQFKFEPGTVEKIDGDGVLIKFKSQTARFFGHSTGTKTGLYRYTPKSKYPTAKVHIEAVYFASKGEVEPYRRHVVEQYEERGVARGEDRRRPYYSGYIIGFKTTKDGDNVITVMTQQRPYPVTFNPKKGQLLYLARMRKRPDWKTEYHQDVEDLQTEAQG
jgi:hypothetical protein